MPASVLNWMAQRRNLPGCEPGDGYRRWQRRLPMLTTLSRVLLTFVAWLLAAALTLYASSKLFGYQFVLLESVGEYRLREVRPMDLMWAFFGYSPRYGVFLGIFELVCSALLLHPRTRTVGAILATAILANIVFLDIEYEVYGPLGMAIVQLLLALALVAAGWRSVFDAAKALLCTRGGFPAWATVLVGAAWCGWLVYLCGVVLERRASHQHLLRGGWNLSRYEVAGDDVALTPGSRLPEPMLFFEFGNAAVLALDGVETPGAIVLRSDGRRLEWVMDLARARAGERDAVTFEAAVTLEGDRLVLDGVRGGQEVRMELRRRPRWRPVPAAGEPRGPQ